MVKHILPTLALNLLLTILSAVLCGVFAYQLASWLAFWTHPSAYGFLYREGGSISTPRLERFEDYRQTLLYLGLVAGIVAVQVTMLVAPLRKPRPF